MSSDATSIDRDHPLEDILSQAVEQTDGDSVTVQDILELYGDRAFGPIFTLLGLLAVIPPVSTIPGLPAIIGILLILFAGQILLGQDYIWLPDFITDRAIDKDKLEKAHDKTSGFLATIDCLVTDRLEWATSGPARYGAGVLVCLLSLMMIPLEVVPFAVAAPGLAITLIGIALLARDGALMIAAYLVASFATYLLIVYSPLGKALGIA